MSRLSTKKKNIKTPLKTYPNSPLQSQQYAHKAFEPIQQFLSDCFKGEYFFSSEKELLVTVIIQNKSYYINFNHHVEGVLKLVDTLIDSYKKNNMFIDPASIEYYLKSKTLLAHMTAELKTQEEPEISSDHLQDIRDAMKWAKKLVEATPYFILAPLIIMKAS